MSVDSVPKRCVVNEDKGSKPILTAKEDETSRTTSALKLMLRSDPARTDNSRKRIQQIVDQGMKKLQKSEANDGANDPDDQNKPDSRSNKVKPLHVESASVLSDIIDKLNKALNEDDLKSFLEMKAKLYCQSSVSTETEIKDREASDEQSAESTVTPQNVARYQFPKLFTPTDIDQEALNNLDAHFTSLEQIEDLCMIIHSG